MLALQFEDVSFIFIYMSAFQNSKLYEFSEADILTEIIVATSLKNYNLERQTFEIRYNSTPLHYKTKNGTHSGGEAKVKAIFLRCAPFKEFQFKKMNLFHTLSTHYKFFITYVYVVTTPYIISSKE